MAKICRFTTLASRDLESIVDYIADQGDFDTAERVLAMVNEKCRRLASFPALGRRRDELSPSVRSFPAGSYLIFYRIVDDSVEILRIVSGYRDLDTLFEED